MQRYHVINKLIKFNDFKNYLEIGVRNPDECFNKIKCENRTSVDPGLERGANSWKYDYEMTSDDYFDQLDATVKFDCVFIDGMHKALQVYKDVMNAMFHLSYNGCIVLHDTNPPTEAHARSNYHDIRTKAGGFWNGTVWKAVKYLSQFNTLDLYTINCDWGVTVIQNADTRKMIHDLNDYDLPEFYEWDDFDLNRKEILNLISVEEFMQKL